MKVKTKAIKKWSYCRLLWQFYISTKIIINNPYYFWAVFIILRTTCFHKPPNFKSCWWIYASIDDIIMKDGELSAVFLKNQDGGSKWSIRADYLTSCIGHAFNAILRQSLSAGYKKYLPHLLPPWKTRKHTVHGIFAALWDHKWRLLYRTSVFADGSNRSESDVKASWPASECKEW